MIQITMAKNEASRAVRDEFSKLNLDGKTSFLVEAVFSTAGSAIHEIGERVTSLVDLVTGSMWEAQADATPNVDTESESSASATEEEKGSGKTFK